LRLQLPGKQCGRQVLVDNGLAIDQAAIAGHRHRNATAAACNDDVIAAEQRVDGLDLHHRLGPGRRHAAAPATTDLLHDTPAIGLREPARRGLVHHGPDGLGRVLERRIVFVDDHLGRSQARRPSDRARE